MADLARAGTWHRRHRHAYQPRPSPRAAGRKGRPHWSPGDQAL